MSSKPSVLVIGGKRKNIPAWADSAFEIQLLDQDGAKARIEPPEKPAQAIVVFTNAVSHQHSSQAHELGAEWGIPVLKARNGWSTAVVQAAQAGAHWFVNAAQAGAEAAEDEEAADVVDNAWRQLAEQEIEKREALEKRLGKIQGKLDRAHATIERLRSGAEERVLSEIRRRAAEVRATVAGENAEVAAIARRLLDEINEVRPRLEQVEKRLQGQVD